LNKDTIYAFIFWILFSVLLEIIVIVFRDTLYPIQGSEQAIFIDNAFLLLTILSVPIFTLVCVMLVYSIVKFRGNKNALNNNWNDSKTNKGWGWAWLVWSTILCLIVVVHPGYTGIKELHSTMFDNPDLTINVTGQRWQWKYEYLDSEHKETIITLKRKDDVVILPNESLIRFNITAPENDVLHSFWIPAFRMKVDAVPGLITSLDVNTNKIAGFKDDINYRVQCAELCGIGHAPMASKVEVIEKSEFHKWLIEKIDE